MMLLSAAAPARPLPPILFQSRPPPPRASSRDWISNTPPGPPKLLPLRLFTKCQAAGDTTTSTSTSTSTSVYQGVYGPWTLDSSDVREVILYRSGLVTAAASFVVAASTAFLPTDSFLTTHLIHPYLNLFYALGAGGIGLSLVLIHIYVTQIKRTLQALWALGVLGSLATYFTLAQPAGQNLIQYVIDHPTALWLVGPLFAAFTGLVFKEVLCWNGGYMIISFGDEAVVGTLEHQKDEGGHNGGNSALEVFRGVGEVRICVADKERIKMGLVLESVTCDGLNMGVDRIFCVLDSFERKNG